MLGIPMDSGVSSHIPTYVSTSRLDAPVEGFAYIYPIVVTAYQILCHAPLSLLRVIILHPKVAFPSRSALYGTVTSSAVPDGAIRGDASCL